MSGAQSSRAPVMSGPDPSRAPEVPARHKTWVILACIPDVVVDKFLPGTADMSLEFEDPPRTTVLTVPKRIAPDPDRGFPYVVVAHPSGLLLLRTTCGLFGSVYYLCDARTRVATRLPDPDPAEKCIISRRGVGLIADPRSNGHYMVAQLLHPTSSTQHTALVCYSTETNAWAVKELGSSPRHPPWGSRGGVVTHEGKLWWVDLPYGILTCDPFLDRPDLRYVALPEGRVMANDSIHAHAGVDKHRCVKASEGKLRYVEIHGLSDEQRVSMWTLVDPEGPVWEHEYEVLLDAIWADESYMAAGLPPHKVPAIALIHPKDHGVLYFFQGARLFAVDMRASERRVLECENSYNARFVHAWELPPMLPRFGPSSSAGMKRLAEDELSLKMSQIVFSLQNLVQVLSDILDEESESSEPPSVDASDRDEEP